MPFPTSLSRGLVAATLATALSFVSTPASAAVIRFVTTFGPEAALATGSGSARALFDTTMQTLALEATFSGLSGVTTVAHIHCCTAVAGTGTIGVAVTPGTLPGFPVGVTSGTYARILDLTDPLTYTAGFRGTSTPAEASARLLAGMLNGNAYFNIHSSTFGGGEIRGFLQVPEPGVMAMLGVALAGAALRRRRHQ